MTHQAILSTETGSYTNTVQLSVMPKGVEHPPPQLFFFKEKPMCNYQ